MRILETLHAVGTPDQMVTVTSASQNPSNYDWNYFQFENGILSYCKAYWLPANLNSIEKGGDAMIMLYR